MDQFVPVGDLRTLLLSRGHTLGEPEDRPGGLTVEPPEDVYLTVALDADVVLDRRCRQRFFVCKPDPLAILTAANVPEAFRRRWIAMVQGTMAGLPRDVLAALATWTATRLLRFDRVFAWADKPVRFYEEHRGNVCDQVAEILGSTIGSGLLRSHLDADASAVASVLETRDPEFPFLLANDFLRSSRNFLEIRFTVGDGSEAFTMHHHDKVITSIPDSATRSSLVGKFSSTPAIFTDESGYVLNEEPEDMTDEEWWGES
jgi:hypothetical protein